MAGAYFFYLFVLFSGGLDGMGWNWSYFYYFFGN